MRAQDWSINHQAELGHSDILNLIPIIFMTESCIWRSSAEAELRQASLGAHFSFRMRYSSAVVAHVRIPLPHAHASRTSLAPARFSLSRVCFPMCRRVLTTRRINFFPFPPRPYSSPSPDAKKSIKDLISVFCTLYTVYYNTTQYLFFVRQ